MFHSNVCDLMSRYLRCMTPPCFRWARPLLARSPSYCQMTILGVETGNPENCGAQRSSHDLQLVNSAMSTDNEHGAVRSGQDLL
jgi:hypothetical protein